MATKDLKRQKAFKTQKNPKSKRNPQTLRKVLHEIEQHLFQGNRTRAAKELSALLGNLKDKGTQTFHPAKIRAVDIKGIIDDHTPIKYWHISLFAERLGIPTSFLLLFVKFRSLHNSLAEAKAETEKLKLIGQHDRLIKTLELLTEDMKKYSRPEFSDLQKWAEKIKEQPIGPLFD
jgi:hypothetical protein